MTSDPTVTSRAGTDRILRTEPQVRLTNLFSNRTISETSSLFRTYALPLSFVRFLRPRVSRGGHAECPHNARAQAPNGGHGFVLDSAMSQPHPRTRQSHNAAVNMASPWPCPCPQSVRASGPAAVTANCLRAGNVPEQSAACPRPRESRELSHILDCPRLIGGLVQAAFSPGSRQHSQQGASAYVLV